MMDFVKNGLRYGLQAVSGPIEKRNEARTHIRRRLALEYLGRAHREITFQRNGFTWTGSPKCTITRAIFIDGRHQDVFIDSLEKWIDKKKPVVVNVGANIGDTALPLSKIWKRVLAIEPSPETFSRLQNNVRQNGLGELITCCQVAISNTAGTAELVIADQPGNTELLGDNGSVGFDGDDLRRAVVSVATKPLDDVLKDYHIAPHDVALVWSDTQGFEAQVIESGSGLWAAGVPLWVEVWPKGLECHGGIDKFLNSCKQHFKRFVAAHKVREAPEPIQSLASLVTDLRAKGTSTDILLIP